MRMERALSPELRSLFDQAIAATNALAPHWVREESEARDALLDHAMTAAGFAPRPCSDAFSGRVIDRASSLDPAQRAAAEFLALHPELPTERYPLPGSPWAIRGWLGLDPPSVLFGAKRADGCTPYEVMRAFRASSNSSETRKKGRALYRSLGWLPVRDRVQALADMSFAEGDLYACTHTVISQALSHADIDDSLGPWALGSAQRLLDRRAHGHSNAWFPALLPTYLALVRAGEADDARLDPLLPLCPSTALSVQREMVNAISEARRETALLGAVENVMWEADRVLGLRRLLRFYPYPKVAAYLLDHAHEARNPKRAFDAVRVAALEHPAIAAILDTPRPTSELPFY